ncbi:hypothetical protein BaRGS_00036026, partial [Batillaria attramentaria]
MQCPLPEMTAVFSSRVVSPRVLAAESVFTRHTVACGPAFWCASFSNKQVVASVNNRVILCQGFVSRRPHGWRLLSGVWQFKSSWPLYWVVDRVSIELFEKRPLNK